MPSMVSPMRTSSTCQARGRDSRGEASRAPKPRPENHSTDATDAPAANHQRPACPWVLAIEPTSSTVSR